MKVIIHILIIVHFGALVKATYSTMSPDMEAYALSTIRQAFQKFPTSNPSTLYHQTAEYIRQQFQQRYGGKWTCVIGTDYTVAFTPLHQNNIFTPEAGQKVHLYQDSDSTEAGNGGGGAVSGGASRLSEWARNGNLWGQGRSPWNGQSQAGGEWNQQGPDWRSNGQRNDPWNAGGGSNQWAQAGGGGDIEWWNQQKGQQRGNNPWVNDGQTGGDRQGWDARNGDGRWVRGSEGIVRRGKGGRS